jgi:hypothetical protein
LSIVGLVAWSASASAETKTFTYTGTEQEFDAPAGVTSVHVVAIGGAGGEGFEGAPGGRGAVVSGDLSVTPGAPLYVEVGGSAAGSPACLSSVPCLGGFNGGGSSVFGGGGGGASDVRTTSSTKPGTLEARLLVAAGGGGGGESCPVLSPLPGGPGGDAEKPGGQGSNCGVPGGEGGRAGKEAEGGAGGSPEGKPGSLGAGGEGGGKTGGGGGGRYGGGGGGNTTGGTFPEGGAAGGGGGGSNLIPAGGTFVGTAKTGEEGSVTITYTPVLTCGRTTVGKSADALLANVKRVYQCASAAGASIPELFEYLSPTKGATGQQLIKGVIYADASGKPGALLGVSEQLTFKSTEAAGWYPLKFAVPVRPAGSSWWFGVITGASGKVASEHYDSFANGEDYNNNLYTSGPSKTFGPVKTTNEAASLYAVIEREG